MAKNLYRHSKRRLIRKRKPPFFCAVQALFFNMAISYNINAALVEHLNARYENTNSPVRIILEPRTGLLFRNNDVETGDDFDEITEGSLWNLLSVGGVNRIFRNADESHLYPVHGRFNATERAIRRLRRLRRDGLCLNDGYEYALALDTEIASIVNDSTKL